WKIGLCCGASTCSSSALRSRPSCSSSYMASSSCRSISFSAPGRERTNTRRTWPTSSARTWRGLPSTSEPSAAPTMISSSTGCQIRLKVPPMMRKPPNTAPRTMKMPNSCCMVVVIPAVPVVPGGRPGDGRGWPVGLFLLEHAAHLGQRALVDLADPGRGQVQHLGDLLQVELELVVQLDHLLLALVQRQQRARDAGRVDGAAFRAWLLALHLDAIGQQGVEAGELARAVVDQQLLVFLGADLQRAAQLGALGLAAQLAAQVALGRAQAVRTLARTARPPVLAAQFVEDGAADAHRRI